MLTYSFTDLGSESLYEHLYNCIKNDILSGNLSPGYKLPSKRTFAKNLGISTITVENAYALLVSEGYVYSIPKKGYYVCDIAGLSRAVPVIRKSEGKKESYIADFVKNSSPMFPFATWARLMREVISHRERELLEVAPPGGTASLREAIAEHLYQFRGMRVEPEQIIIGAGTEYLYGLIIQLLGYERVFAVEDPGYGKIAKIYGCSNVKCVHIPLDEGGIDMQELKKSGADVIHISPSHHFPTGRVTPISRRYEILSWAAQGEDRYIIEDDYDSEFRLLGRPIPPLKSMDITDRVIYMNTFTKSLASTIRISYMILPKGLLEKFYKRLGFYACTVSNFEQYTLSEFIGGGYFANHINRLRKHYKELRDLIMEEIQKSFTGAKITEEDAGLHFLLELDTRAEDMSLKAAARRSGVNISFLSEYFHDKTRAAKHTIVINYSGLDLKSIPAAVSALAKCVNTEGR
ncbi:MAG: PLP-dependent aminotransferase family protein [Clostridiales bacterium]|nr:PLP-dependent aminotransferase family protein [Clostridiales bacterium]